MFDVCRTGPGRALGFKVAHDAQPHPVGEGLHSGSFHMKYGRVEVEAKLPTGDWIWPAIWMLPEVRTDGEIEGEGRGESGDGMYRKPSQVTEATSQDGGRSVD